MHVVVERLIIENGRACGVQFRRGGELIEVRTAGEVILAAGAIQTGGYTFDGASSFMLWGAIILNAARAVTGRRNSGSIAGSQRKDDPHDAKSPVAWLRARRRRANRDNGFRAQLAPSTA